MIQCTLILVLRVGYNVHDAIILRFVHNGANLYSFFLGVSNDIVLCFEGSDIGFEKLVVDSGLDVESGRCEADLAAVRCQRIDGPDNKN